jgi:thiamine biosynthesis protein ThiS
MTELVALTCILLYILPMLTTSPTSAQITLNGGQRPLANLAMVSDLIAELNLDPRKVAIELNRTIVPRSAYATTPIMDGDAIEVVGFIGGG